MLLIRSLRGMQPKQAKWAAARSMYAASPQAKRAAVRSMYAANPQPKQAAARSMYAANPQPKQAAARSMYAANPEPKRAVARSMYAANPEGQGKENAQSNNKKKKRGWTCKLVNMYVYTHAHVPMDTFATHNSSVVSKGEAHSNYYQCDGPSIWKKTVCNYSTHTCLYT